MDLSNDSEDAYDTAAVAPPQVRLSCEDLLNRSGIDVELLTDLITAGVIKPATLATTGLLALSSRITAVYIAAPPVP